MTDHDLITKQRTMPKVGARAVGFQLMTANGRRLRVEAYQDGRYMALGHWFTMRADGVLELVKDGEPCHKSHPDMPEGYIARSEWARKMAKTHKQVQCLVCGLWGIWEPLP